MATNTNKLTISGFAEMARSVQTYVSGQLQNINFSGLQDTPLGYLGHSGDYLVVNGGESGINFTGIEKIAQDLTDYGFGNGTFTGLVDTPSTYETGKFIGVTNDGNIEYIDIELLKNIADAPEIEIVSGFLQLNDQRELVWGFPPSPEDNGDVNYAISGATHFTGLLDTPTGYTHNAYIQVDGDSKSLNYVDINKVAVDLENIGAINQPQYFTGLNDTPSEYDNGKFLVSTENGLSFTDIPEPVVAFTGLNDTPAEYDNGKFLVSTENGLGFTDVPEPIVAFTGLSDTPSDFTAGKYLRVNDAGDALEYVDITGVSSGVGGGSATSYIDSVVTKTEAGPIDKRSTDTTASSTNYYRVPIESLRFDDLEVGATYRINVSLLGYHGSNDLGASFAIHNRASSFSSDINLDAAGINDYENNGGDPDPAIITIASAGNDTTVYGETHSQTKIFEATGTHLDVLANSTSQNSFFRNIIIQLEKLTVGGSGSAGQCGINSLALTNDHPSADSINIAIPDAIIAETSFGNDHIFSLNVLTKNSIDLANNRNLIYTSYGTQYSIDFTNDTNGSYNQSQDIIAAHQQNLKWFIDNGRALYYGSCGGSGGNYEFCTVGINGTQNFTNNQTWVNFNGSLSTGSTDLTYLVSSINAYGLRPSEDGYYDIDTAIKAVNNSANASTTEMHVYVYRHDIDTGINTLIGSGTEFWNDGGGHNGPKCQVNVPDVYLTTNNVILIGLYGWRSGTNFSVALETAPQYTHLNLSRADIGGSGSGSTTFTGLSDTPSDFTAGKYLRVNDAGDALEYVDITDVSSGVGGGGQIHARFSGSTGAILTKSSNWDTYVDSITFPQGSWNGYLQINYKNNFTTVPTTLATADHRENVPNLHVFAQVQAQSVSSCAIVIADTEKAQVQAEFNVVIFSDEIAGGSGGNYEFCRSAFSSSSTIGHGNSSLDLDPNQLTNNSQDWTHTDTTLNVVGIKIPEDGLYNLNLHIAAHISSSAFSHWMNNISLFEGTLYRVKPDGTTNLLLLKQESKNTGNGTHISVDLAQDNEYLEAGDFLFIKSQLYDNTASSTTFPVEGKSFFSISKAGAGGGSSSSGGDSTDFVSLTDTPVDYIGHSGDYMIVNNNEDGIHFTGIEKIAQDLTDYGFSAGEGGGGSSYFTGLLDTPNDYTNQAGKYVRVSQQEDGLDFIASSELLGLGTVDGYDFCADFHLQSDTTNNSSSFQDLSYDPYSVGSQNVIHSTSITPIYGSSSLYFNGDARLSVGDNSTFSTLSKKLINNYTVQFWINPAIGSQNQPIMGTAGQNTDHGFRILLRSDNKVQFDVFKGLTNDTSVTLVSSSAINVNSWTHVALINNDNVLTFYINGTSSGSINWTKGGTNITPTYPLLIGGLPLDNVDISYLDGYMQDIRIDRTAFNTQYFPPQELTVSQCNANQSELTFSSLKDTPVNYSNAGGKYVRVSENESQLEYVGITVAGSTNNEFSNSFLTQNITGDEVINELSYGGLDVGKTYRLSTTLCLNADSASDFPKVDFYNGDRKVISLFSKGSTSTVSNSMLFIARDENIFASGRNLSSTAYVMGNPEISFMQLELPPSIAVELDEEVILPPSTGAGGIFSIADIKSNAIIEDKDNLLDFSQIVEDLNEEIGGPTGVMLIGDVKLNTIIEKGYNLGGSQEPFTGVQVDENGDPVEILKIADVKANAIISQDHDVQSNFTGEMPLFSVLNIGDMKTLSTIQQTGIGDNQTVDFPTGAFDWQNI